MPQSDARRLCSLGKIQTNRLTKQIVWNSLYTADYANSYGIDPKVVSDFADGYLDYLQDTFEVKGGIEELFKVFDKHVTNNRSGHSFYDYTHYMIVLD